MSLKWEILNPGGGPGQTPGSRCGHVFVNSPDDSGAYLLFGGQEKNGPPRNDVSVLGESFGRWAWKQLPCKGFPPPGVYDCAAWPVVLRGGAEGAWLIVHGGITARNRGTQTTHALHIQSSTWSSVFAPMAPPPRGMSIYGQAASALWLFGGRAAPEGLKYDDLWCLRLDDLAEALGSNSECFWSSVSTPGPSARHSTSFAEESSTGELYLYGGVVGPDDQRSDTICDELWKLDAHRGRWSGPLQTSGYRPSARCGPALFRTGETELVLWGGEGPGGRACSDLHILDLECLLWSQPCVGGPDNLPRRRHASSFFANGVALVFGGEPPPQSTSDAEKARLASSEGEEGLKDKEKTSNKGDVFVLKQTEALEQKTGPGKKPNRVPPARLPPGVLDDAEALLMIAKKQKNVMERDLQKAYNERAELQAQLRQLRENHNEDQRDLSLAKIVAQESMTAHAHEQHILRHLRQQKAAEQSYRKACEETASRFKNTLAAAEALLLELNRPDAQTSPEVITQCRDTHRAHIRSLRDGLAAWQTKAAEEEETVLRAQQELQRLVNTRPRTSTLRSNSVGHVVPEIQLANVEGSQKLNGKRNSLLNN